MRTLGFLIEKEFKQSMRNRIIPVLIVLYPVLVLLIFPWAINFEVKNIRIDIVDNSQSQYSQRLINKIAASQYFILNSAPHSYTNAMTDIENKKADIILEIPTSFDTDITKERGGRVFVSANAVNSTQGLMGSNYLTQIVNNFSAEIRNELMPQLSQARAPIIEAVPTYRYNHTLDYKTFMLPAFIVLLITLITGILPSLNIVLEKETGTIQQINATPIGKFSFILAKLIPYWIIGILILSTSILVTWLIYGLLPSGGFLPIYVSAVVFIIGISGMGIIVSNYSESLQQSMFLMMFLILIIILLSGLFTPIEPMPRWAQHIAYANPLTYFMQIMRLVYLKGSSLSDIAKPLLTLVGFAVVLNGWAVVSYRKR